MQYQAGAGRWGSGEVRVECVDLLDASGTAVQVARTAEPAAFRIRLTSDARVERPEVVLSIHDQSGVLVSEVSTRSRGLVIDAVEGERTLTLGVERLPLAEGTYELSCTVRDESGQRELDTRVKFVRFDVQRGRVHDGGLLTLGGAWRVD